MSFGVLGALSIARDGTPVVIGAARLRCLLAVLLCRVGQPVAAASLIDDLWGDQPPPNARKALQVYVHRLRAALGEDRRIRHGECGYTLALAAGELDAQLFADLTDRARQARRSDRLDDASDHLTRALGLWRGPAYAGVDCGAGIVAETARDLDEKRLLAHEERSAVELDRGRHGELVPQLRRLVGEHPYRERLSGYLMLALHRTGRTAEALESFAQTRNRLIDELGIEPGRPMQRLHEAILRDAGELAWLPAAGVDALDGVSAGPRAPKAPEHRTGGEAGARAMPLPRQLPADVPGFVGRTDELGALHALLTGRDGAQARTDPIIVCGMAGVGKTALAVHWACSVASRFPDGQLHVDLRGYATGRPVRPIDALTRLLRALGVPRDAVPVDADEAGDLYRSALHDRRVLVVLDNARDADQVRPLLPGSPGCLTLVTSRDRLTGLVARNGARTVPLLPLPPSQSLRLLADLLGARAAADRAALSELADACGHLPLALRVAAANLAGDPNRGPAAYAANLRAGAALADLDAGHDVQASVQAAFAASYRALPHAEQRMFRLLSVPPGPDVTVDVAAVLADTTVERARALLHALVCVHLLTEVEPGRYALHDLVRRFAHQQLDRGRHADERLPALARLCEFYARTAPIAG